MNVLFVTQFFYPENFRINDMALKLKALGHEVTVLTGMPNYPGGDFFEGYSNKGLEGVGREELWNDIRIIRVPIIPRKKGAIRLCLNYLSFVISGINKSKKLSGDFDVIYAFGTSPITQAIPAITYKKKYGAKIILNVQDLWPDNVIAITGVKNKLIISLLDKLVDYIYNRCDIILGTSKSFVEAISSRKGLADKDKVKYYPQYAVVKRSDLTRRDLLPENRFHITFTGNVGEGQGLELVIEAAKLLKENSSNICFDIVGDGRARERLMESVKEKQLEDYVVFHGSFPESEIPPILNTSDAALLILKKDPIFERTIPAKLQTYLVCNCPVLGCVMGEAKRIIEDNQVGICASDFSGEALFRAAVELEAMDIKKREEMATRAIELSDREFDSDRLINQLVMYMEQLKG